MTGRTTAAVGAGPARARGGSYGSNLASTVATSRVMSASSDGGLAVVSQQNMQTYSGLTCCCRCRGNDNVGSPSQADNTATGTAYLVKCDEMHCLGCLTESVGGELACEHGEQAETSSSPTVHAPPAPDPFARLCAVRHSGLASWLFSSCFLCGPLFRNGRSISETECAHDAFGSWNFADRAITQSGAYVPLPH